MAGRGRMMAQLLTLPLKGLAAAFAIAAPLLGVWVASSLAAHLNGPVWSVVLSGLALFPIGPLSWDLFAEWRRRRKRRDLKRFLTFFDRMILRTLTLNLVFLAGLLALAPLKVFEAVSTRGDWVLDGRTDDTSAVIREGMFWAAEELEWLYRAVHDNPFDEMADETVAREDDDISPSPAPELPVQEHGLPTGEGPEAEAASPPSDVREADEHEEPQDQGAIIELALRDESWPLPAKLHPAITSLPKEKETSIASVAAYLKKQEAELFWLVKALHDYVADRVAYDALAYRSGEYPPQDAETVFRERVAVCAGYANLLAALGKEAGVRIAWVSGDARSRGAASAGDGHAWNAAEIDGEWYLLDATWNAGAVDGAQFEKAYRTHYLFAPPHVFGMDHFPNDPKWQLREEPLTRGQFLRQPMLSASFFAHGLELVTPKRSQITVSGDVHIEVANPRGVFALAHYAPAGQGGEGEPCTVTEGERIRMDCHIPEEGRYDVSLFVSRRPYGSFGYAGSVGVNNRP